jgi:hypothetical protein
MSPYEQNIRKLLERIEVRYLHTNVTSEKQFKFSASQKYVELCTELIRITESVEFQVLVSAFDLIVKPAGPAINYLNYLRLAF